MNYTILIIVGIAGIIIGSYFGVRKREPNLSEPNGQRNLFFEQSKRKRKNKKRILEFLRENEKITNNDVERLCRVSNATAERYLDQLEKEGELTQHGKIGTNVFYTLK